MSIRLTTILSFAALAASPANATKPPVLPIFAISDYPRQSLRQREEGSVRTRLLIGKTGMVKRCTILVGATPTLDAATCRILKERARFVPARDSAGNAIASTYDPPTISWRISD
ncbi:MAG: energy transducer TonB [Sphingomonas bacterium]|nr:energy transducer TonB [Sphingomonas bacterium]